MTVLVMVAAALLPAALLGMVLVGDRVVAHPRYRAFRWALYEFQRSHPAVFTCVLGVLMTPAILYFAANSEWLLVGVFALQLVGTHYSSARAIPPFGEVDLDA